VVTGIEFILVKWRETAKEFMSKRAVFARTPPESSHPSGEGSSGSDRQT
jgi:hypothetical protein